jgi:hypothetical protein
MGELIGKLVALVVGKRPFGVGDAKQRHFGSPF